MKETASALAVQSYLLLFVFLLECFSVPKVRVRSPLELPVVSINIVLVFYFDVSYLCIAVWYIPLLFYSRFGITFVLFSRYVRILFTFF